MRIPRKVESGSWPLLIACVGIAALGTVACTGKYKRPTTAEKFASSPERVERGRYMVNSVSGCGFCHTPRVDDNWLNGERGDAFLAGGMVLSESGIFWARIPNITQDVDTGIGGWTDDEIARAIRDGIHKDDSLLWPPMLFYMYDKMSDEDVQSIIAYLRTVPPIKNKVDRAHDAKAPMGFLVNRGLMHHEPAKNVKAPPATDKKAYGGYLARMAACVDCHSLTDMGPDLEKNLLGGSQVPLHMNNLGKVSARNLTPDPDTGLGKYTADQIKEALKNGKRLDGRPMLPPMSLLIPHVSTWTDEDLDALVTYLKSVKPIKHKIPDPEPSEESKKSVGL